MTTIADALQFAETAHGEQVDKSGAPYMDHVRQVVSFLQADGEDEQVLIAGALHDVVEDTETPLALVYILAGPRVGFAVGAVTRTPAWSPDAYYQRILDAAKAGQPDALKVKRADIRSNMDPARMALLDEETRTRLTEKYAKALELLG